MPAPENSACRLIGGFRVKHFDCSDYPDGTITNVITGEIEEN